MVAVRRQARSSVGESSFGAFVATSLVYMVGKKHTKFYQIQERALTDFFFTGIYGALLV